VQVVMRRLVSAMSLTSLAPAHQLPANLLLLLTLFTIGDAGKGDEKMLRVLFSEPDFDAAFPVFEGGRDDLLQVADLVKLAGTLNSCNNVSPDEEYYILARLAALTDPNHVFNSIYMVLMEGLSVQNNVLKQDLQLRVSVAEKVRAVLSHAMSALQADSCESIPSFPALVGILSRLDFFVMCMSKVIEYYELLKQSKVQNFDLGVDFEESSLMMFSTCARQLFMDRKYRQCAVLCGDIYPFYEQQCLAILPTHELRFLECLCAVNLCDNQAAVPLSFSMEQSLELLLNIMNELGVNGSLLQSYSPTLQHYYYYLMCVAVQAKNKDMIIHFGQSAMGNSDSELTLVISKMVFITYLEARQWLESYAAISRVPSVEERRACVSRFLSELPENGGESAAGQVICSLPFCEQYALVEETLLLKAKGNLERHDYYHKLLFVFYLNHGDYRGAAGAMYRLASRTKSDRVTRARHLLLVITCLELISPEFQWIAIADDEQQVVDGSSMTSDGRQLFMYSLQDIRSMLTDLELHHGGSVTLSTILDQQDYERAVSLLDADENVFEFAAHFIANDDPRLLTHLHLFSTEQLLKLYTSNTSTKWLQEHWRATNPNQYIAHHVEEVEAVLREHVGLWKRYRSGGGAKRPSDLISSTALSGEKKGLLETLYYEEYLPLTIP
jgi:hypothetical protein